MVYRKQAAEQWVAAEQCSRRGWNSRSRATGNGLVSTAKSVCMRTLKELPLLGMAGAVVGSVLTGLAGVADDVATVVSVAADRVRAAAVLLAAACLLNAATGASVTAATGAAASLGSEGRAAVAATAGEGGGGAVAAANTAGVAAALSSSLSWGCSFSAAAAAPFFTASANWEKAVADLQHVGRLEDCGQRLFSQR